MISAVLFDIDNTLYSYAPCDIAGQEAMYHAFLCEVKSKMTRAEFDQLLAKAKMNVKQHLKGTAACHNRMLYAQQICELAGCFSAERALKLYNAYWDAFLDKMKLFDGIEELFSELKKKNIKIGFCTDLTAQIQMRKMIKLGISTVPEAVVTSEESGIEKPSDIPFRLLMMKLRVDPEHTVMIGDDYEKDILGAERAGIRAIQIGPKCAYQIHADNFYQVGEILKQWI